MGSGFGVTWAGFVGHLGLKLSTILSNVPSSFRLSRFICWVQDPSGATVSPDCVDAWGIDFQAPAGKPYRVAGNSPNYHWRVCNPQIAANRIHVLVFSRSWNPHSPKNSQSELPHRTTPSRFRPFSPPLMWTVSHGRGLCPKPRKTSKSP